MSDIREYVDKEINLLTQKLREQDPRSDKGVIPPRARFFRWSAPALAVSYFTYTGSDASPYPGAITQPDVPRTFQVTWSGGWTGGNITIEYLFDGELLTKELTAAPGSTVVYDIPVTKFIAVRKALVGAGTAAFAASNGFGIESNRRPVETYGIGFVNGSTDLANNTAVADGRVVTFATAANGARNFVFGANVL